MSPLTRRTRRAVTLSAWKFWVTSMSGLAALKSAQILSKRPMASLLNWKSSRRTLPSRPEEQAASEPPAAASAAALAVVARKERLLSAVMGTSRCVVAMTGLFCL